MNLLTRPAGLVMTRKALANILLREFLGTAILSCFYAVHGKAYTQRVVLLSVLSVHKMLRNGAREFRQACFSRVYFCASGGVYSSTLCSVLINIFPVEIFFVMTGPSYEPIPPCSLEPTTVSPGYVHPLSLLPALLSLCSPGGQQSGRALPWRPMWRSRRELGGR